MAHKFSKREIFHYKKLDKFFRLCDKVEVERMVNIINGKTNMSLRLFDYYVTQYVRQNKVSYRNVAGDAYFNVKVSYKAQLNLYKKTFFDPFCRSKEGISTKFDYNYDKKDKSKIINTNIGQLNFFQWAITYKVIDNIEKDYDKVFVAMNEMAKLKKQMKQKKSSTDSTSNSPEEDIQVKAHKRIDGKRVKIVLSFD